MKIGDQDGPEYGAAAKVVFDLRRITFRTARALIEEDANFTEVIHGTLSMMNTPMKMYYAFVDVMHRDDNSTLTERFFVNKAKGMVSGRPTFTLYNMVVGSSLYAHLPASTCLAATMATSFPEQQRGETTITCTKR